MQQHTTYDPILPSETQHVVSTVSHTDLSCENYTGTFQTQAPVYGFRELAHGQKYGEFWLL